MNTNPHLAKALSNEQAITTEAYFDWKITKIFYAALHYLKALAYQRGIEIGETHEEIEKNVRPSSRYQPAMPIKEHAWKDYRELLTYSKIARYDGIENTVIYEIETRKNYQNAEIHFGNFKKYIFSSGLIVPTENLT